MSTRPFIICHMMTSIDGRIDCAMTAQLNGVDDYYKTLSLLSSNCLSGRVTAELEMALKGKFKPEKNEIFGKESFSKKKDSKSLDIVVDTNGTLLWDDDAKYEKHHLIITSEKVTKEYLEYLDTKNISWIACGKDKIDLNKAMEKLYKEFKVERLAVVGGPIINSSFLNCGLLDEVSLLIGPGIDGRKGMPAVFDGFDMEHPVTKLKLEECKSFNSGAVWLRYSLIKDDGNVKLK